jgi:hypothetical protein
MPDPVDRLDDIVENENLQEITLDKSIPYKVHPESFPEDRYAPGVWNFSFQPDKDKHA